MYRDIKNGTISLRSSINFSHTHTHTHTTITCICHPQTYLNKIVIGFSNGDMELWNIHTQQRIFRFFSTHIHTHTHTHTHINTLTNTLTNTNTEKEKEREIEHAITTIIQSTALDVVGIGMSNGMCILSVYVCMYV